MIIRFEQEYLKELYKEGKCRDKTSVSTADYS